MCDIYGGLCPAGSNADRRLSAAVRDATATAVAVAFKQSITINIANNLPGVLGNTNLGNVAEGALAAAVSLVIKEVWSSIFCSQECDDCYPALGINALVNSCDEFRGLRPRGSFEFAERYVWFIDANLDGVFEDTQTILGSDGFIPASALPTQPFLAAVDVFCDGLTLFPWSGVNDQGEIVGVFVDPNNLVVPPPYAVVTGPPLQGSPYAFFYRPNQIW